MSRSPSDHGLDIVRSFTEVPAIDTEKLNRDLTRQALINQKASDVAVNPTEPTPWERQRAEGANKSIDTLANQIPNSGMQKDQAQSDATHNALFPEAESSEEQQ